MEDYDGRQGSEAPSSGSDFYDTDAPKEQPAGMPVDAPAELELPPIITNGHSRVDGADTANYADGGDSSSEMDVSVSSRSSSPDPVTEAPVHAGSKRKLSDVADAGDGPQQSIEDSAKKMRLTIPLAANGAANAEVTPAATTGGPSPSAADRWPTALWQHVFLHLSPASLSRCLRVSRTFNTILTHTKAQPMTKENKNKPRVVDSETLWIQARKNYMPNMPRPLGRFNELEMLQLLGGRTCQFCKRPAVPAPGTTPFNAGPGPDGIRVIWPFGIRTCGQCLEHNTIKDVQILVSPAASLRFGLPYAFRTPDLHFVPEMTRQLPGGIPSHLRVAKVYYNADVDLIQHEYEEAKAFGQGAAEEWRKGLAMKGKEAMADAARWEKWESQVRFGADLAQVLREYDLASFPRRAEGAQGRSAGVNGAHAHTPTVPNGTHALPQPVHAFQNGYPPQFQAPTQQFQPLPRPLRNPQEVEEARQARKTDIERRCMDLEPPLQPNVLQHIESFQAAMQITTPMNDAQWEMLRPRILAQREAAELIEHQRAEQLAALQAAIPSVVPDETFMKPAKEVYDREYEQAQEPLRKRLGEYADEVINGQWHGGQGLDRDSAPTFAVQTLLHVRRRYLEDKEAGTLPTNGQPAVSAGSKQGTPAPDPFLSLDNMKWVYDNKVRTLTDQYRRELFICAGCAEERKPKWFAFEGLIQHYGAKHTTAFSKGNIVVHWQTSDWPEDPPFHTNPSPWIKLDRKMSDFKAHGRARGTQQQGGHDGTFVPPSPGVLLSENPLFSAGVHQSPPGTNGYFSGGQGYPAYPQHQPGPYGQRQSYSYATSAPPQPAIDVSYDAQLTKLSTDAHELWEALEGVKDMLECVRIQTVIHHVVTRFTERFHQKPNLDLLTDALATNPLMRNIKNAHGLACKICVAAQTDGSASYQSYYARIRNVKLYNASSLITHFKIMHQPQEHAGPDWSKDMIELPEHQLVRDLLRAPGMDDDKLALVAAAFPDAFPTPLPQIGVVKEAPVDVGPDSGLASRLLDRLNKKPQQGKKKKGQHGASNGTTPGREGSQEPIPEPTEDEYDPRRPMFVQSEEQAADPARFDTDIARKASAPPPVSGAGAVPFSLAPETLAALSNLTALTSQPVGARAERSPSVGRAEPVRASESLPLVQPDIAAILASLTGQQQQQTATPPASLNNHSVSASRHPPPPPGVDLYTQLQQTSPAVYRPESRRSTSARFDTSYRASAEPPPPTRYADPAVDLQAALARNSRLYEHNQQQQYFPPSSYIDAAPSPYTPQPQPQLQPQMHPRSPPRYRYVYEDEGQAVAYTPLHHQQQPPLAGGGGGGVQYIQLPPEHHHQQYQQYQAQQPQQQSQQQQGYPYGYGYEARPKTVYVDEYGRPLELIPIVDAGAPPPAHVSAGVQVPVQYVGYQPFEQREREQQYARPSAAQGQYREGFYGQQGPAPAPAGIGVHGPQGRYSGSGFEREGSVGRG